jgi:hypothetical protein
VAGADAGRCRVAGVPSYPAVVVRSGPGPARPGRQALPVEPRHPGIGAAAEAVDDPVDPHRGGPVALVPAGRMGQPGASDPGVCDPAHPVVGTARAAAVVPAYQGVGASHGRGGDDEDPAGAVQAVHVVRAHGARCGGARRSTHGGRRHAGSEDHRDGETSDQTDQTDQTAGDREPSCGWPRGRAEPDQVPRPYFSIASVGRSAFTSPRRASSVRVAKTTDSASTPKKRRSAGRVSERP